MSVSAAIVVSAIARWAYIMVVTRLLINNETKLPGFVIRELIAKSFVTLRIGVTRH